MGATPSAPNPRGHGPKNLKNNQNGKVIGDTVIRRSVRERSRGARAVQ